MSKAELRERLRARRQRLDPLHQRRAAQRLARLVARAAFFRRARRLAFYLPNDGEIDPTPLLRLAAAAGKEIYLPRLDRRRRLQFARWRPGEPLVRNRYGIPEPRRGPTTPATRLDLIFVPTVGFDRSGRRLGMGGGFYDRTFARPRPHRRPLLVGLAHHFQECAQLPADPWDVGLDLVVTDRGLRRFSPIGRSLPRP